MKKSLIAILATLFAFMSGTSSFANSENLGIVPDKLAWFTDSIVEQWTETNDPDSDIIEQVLYARTSDNIDGENDFVPVAHRYNRQIVITLGFINLGTDTYRFDNTSRIEISITQDKKTFAVDAIPKLNKTIISPNGRIKKSEFIIKMNNRAFTEAYNNRYGVEALNINPVCGKLLIEDSHGKSLLDNVGEPGYITFITPSILGGPKIYQEIEKNYTLKDILLTVNKVSLELASNDNRKPIFDLSNGSIASVFDVPTTIDEKNDLLVLFTFNDNPVDNKKLSQLLSSPYKAKDNFRIAIMPLSILKTYLPANFNVILFRITFKKTIAQLPESIVPQKYQQVNNADNLQKSYLKLKELAEDGDSEAIDFITQQYDPNLEFFKDGFLFEDYEDAFQWLKQLARKGYTQAQLSVGLYYENGLAVNQNLPKALKCYKIAAEQGNVEAMTCYAVLLRNQSADKHDEAVEWCRKAATLNNARAQYLLSIELLVSKDDKIEKEGLDWLYKSADNGYPAAIYDLALENWFGIRIPINEDNAFLLMERAAQAGYPKAYNMLAFFYLRGIGIEPNGRQAAYYYKLGSENRIPESMYWYGRFLCDGFNVEKDVAKGYQLIKEAATLGDDEAELYIGLDYYVGAIAKKNENEAFKWVEKSVKDGNLNALVALSDFYGMGVGVKKDFKKAIDLLKQAADKKVPLGMYRLGRLIYENKGANAQQGLNYIKEAAKLGDKDAQDYLDNLDSVNDPADEDDAFGDDSAAEEKNDTTNEAPAADEDEDDLFQ